MGGKSASKWGRFPITGSFQRQKMVPNRNVEHLCAIGILKRKRLLKQIVNLPQYLVMMFAGRTCYLTQTLGSRYQGLAACSATWPLQVRPKLAWRGSWYRMYVCWCLHCFFWKFSVSVYACVFGFTTCSISLHPRLCKKPSSGKHPFLG